MADNTLNNTDLDTQNETEPATKHDVGIGGGLGAVGGAVVGGLAGGPIGAVIGAVVGGAASAGAVDVVDKHDHDYGRTAHTTDTDYTNTTAASPGYIVDTDDTTVGTATEYTGPGDYQRTQGVGTVEDTYVAPTAATQTVGTGADQTVELHEEELHASKQAVQTGEVTLHKEVITETRSIDVPVTREEVVIERHAVSGAQAATANVNFDSQADEVIRVPVMEEQVTVQKTPVVTEEISLGKRQVTETEHITDTVRREEAYIENPNNVDVLQRGGTLTDDELEDDDLDSDAAVNRTSGTVR